MQVFDRQTLDRLSAEAAHLPRLRKNLNIHSSDDAVCHRLFNAIEPGTYIQPHRHLDPNKDETFVIIRGRMAILTFDNAGSVASSVVLTVGGEIYAADIPVGTFHTAVSLTAGTIFFESKAGPYHPLTDKEFAPWAPPEGSPEARAYLASLGISP